jgi:hypothetical protein
VAAGVISTGIAGDMRDRLKVVGHGLDAVRLVQCLRMELGHAEILQVEGVKAKEARPEPVVVVNTEEARPADDGIRAIFTKLLSKFMWSRTRGSISRPPLPPAASSAPRSHLSSDVSPSSTAVSAASPPYRAAGAPSTCPGSA